LRLVTTRIFVVVLRIRDQTGRVDPFGGELIPELAAGIILADNADEIDGAAEHSQVVAHVGRTAEPDLFVIEHHHGNRRLGRDPGDAADHEAVQHHVAEHDDLP
jgi:hypothetical protein